MELLLFWTHNNRVYLRFWKSTAQTGKPWCFQRELHPRNSPAGNTKKSVSSTEGTGNVFPVKSSRADLQEAVKLSGKPKGLRAMRWNSPPRQVLMYCECIRKGSHPWPSWHLGPNSTPLNFFLTPWVKQSTMGFLCNEGYSWSPGLSVSLQLPPQKIFAMFHMNILRLSLFLLFFFFSTWGIESEALIACAR